MEKHAAFLKWFQQFLCKHIIPCVLLTISYKCWLKYYNFTDKHLLQTTVMYLNKAVLKHREQNVPLLSALYTHFESDSSILLENVISINIKNMQPQNYFCWYFRRVWRNSGVKVSFFMLCSTKHCCSVYVMHCYLWLSDYNIQPSHRDTNTCRWISHTAEWHTKKASAPLTAF